MSSALSEIIAHAVTVWVSLAPFLFMGALIAGALHVLLPPNLLKRALSGKGGVWRAVLIGVPLPLCSCGVIPAGLGLRRDGASRGAAVGFLVSTPQTGVDSILVSASMLGSPFALYKVLAATITGLIGGGVTELVSHPDGAEESHTEESHTEESHTEESHTEESHTEESHTEESHTEESHTEGSHGASGCVSSTSAEVHDAEIHDTAARPNMSKLMSALKHGESILDSIWGWLVFGVLTSALISYALPLFMTNSNLTVESSSIGALIISYALTLTLSVPLYICATASVPIAAELVSQGLPIGAALIFLMAGPATNIATIGAVYRGLGARALLVYLMTIIGGSVIFALILDLGLGWELPQHLIKTHTHTYAWWEITLSLVLGVWLALRVGQWAWITMRVLITSRRSSVARDLDHEITHELTHELAVSGITCQGCVRKLNRALMSRGDVSSCAVNETLDQVSVTGEISRSALVEAIQGVGFSVLMSSALADLEEKSCASGSSVTSC